MAGCKDCAKDGVTTKRAAPHPGPRCLSHHRAVKRQRSARSHGQRTEKVYGITNGEYEALYQAQNGRCAICRIATGKTKRLAVDHDHDTGLIRGLCCGRCNYGLLGMYGPEKLQRALDYLNDPPAVAVIGRRIVPDTHGSDYIADE